MSQSKYPKPKIPIQTKEINSTQRFDTKGFKAKISNQKSHTKEPEPEITNPRPQKDIANQKAQTKESESKITAKDTKPQIQSQRSQQILVRVTLWSFLCWPWESSQNGSCALWRVHDMLNMDLGTVSGELGRIVFGIELALGMHIYLTIISKTAHATSSVHIYFD